VEWQLFSDVMSSTDVTKVAVDMKSKLTILRERDIIVKGPLEDPAIAKTLLKVTHSAFVTTIKQHWNTTNLQIPAYAEVNKIAVETVKTANAAASEAIPKRSWGSSSGR
jgi:DNA polymerase I-like protein with 3'-5' exonuclease and polymerase domains